MEEPHTTSQVPHSELLDEISACGNDCSCEGNKHSNSLSMPICFLVREQAKSQVAIQDLQSRLSHVETVQVDVIDTLMHFRNYLNEVNSDFSATPSCINITNSPSTYSTSKTTTAFHSAYEPPHPVQKSCSYGTKARENASDEFQRTSSMVTIQDQPQKLFDSTKSKDSALESDKQDSGLDSDCREHHDCQSSIRTAPHWINQEANDQLLQLLDEISFRSEYLQKQLAVTENTTVIQNGMLPAQPNVKIETCSPTRSSNGCLETTCNLSQEPKDKKIFELSTINESRDIGIQVTVPSSTKINSSGLAGFLEGKSICDRSSGKRVGKSIDSSMVSSILKETNVVELQRQALVYLVDNAVLNARLREMEQAIACKNLESEKVENSLKEEGRLLMMENRELRICLDEQKMEANVFKSRVAMLERVLQSMNVENQELNWQLGESFNIQQLAKKGYNLSSATTPSSVASSTRSFRKTSSLPSQACRNSTLNYAKSKLLSSNSTFLDSTAEESEDNASNQIQKQYRNSPLLSSTPFQRPKGTVIDSTLSPALPLSFYSAKKCLKSGHSFDSEGCSFKTTRSERYGDCDIPEACVRKRPSPHSPSQKPLTLATGNVSKFPFNTILEKLKANSEVRLSRHIPNAKDGDASVSASDHEVESNCRDSPPTEGQYSKHSKSSQGSVKSGVQTKKSGNIHQRIQNILDRIVAESEEAS
ncbi:uncharacterized protein [Parasteatoda tepidariorum]|uniref:uncharacterized protein n=1 Tax=Parasteatoda tepidariorum TaxID=114398 RepID=UPI0039BD9013